MYTLGIDIGSTTSKCVILKNGKDLVANSIIVSGTGTRGPQTVFENILAESGLQAADIQYIIATGYGRTMFDIADKEMTELSCHSKGASFIFSGIKTIIDIGGQDAKVININDQGKMVGFVMNDKCAAGTGRFLDVMANILQMRIDDLEIYAAKAVSPVSISNTCTVFAESEVISQLSIGVKTEDLVAGICNSVASRVGALARRLGVKEKVFMSGGVAKNGGVRNALAQELKTEILYSSLSQFTGAIGAAVLAYESIQ